MNVIEDRRNHTTAATFPAEGPVFQGGFCGWGLYNEGIAENLRYMREVLFPPMREMLAKNGGIAIKPILAEGMQMGDENHTRQTAADLLFDKQVLPQLFELDLPKEQIMRTVRYIVETPRFFHCYGQGASRAAAIAADGAAIGKNGELDYIDNKTVDAVDIEIARSANSEDFEPTKEKAAKPNTPPAAAKAAEAPAADDNALEGMAF